jgi:phage protein D
MADTAILPQDIYPKQDFYVPGFRIIVKGKELRAVETDVVSLIYSDSKNEIDSTELTVNNWDPNGNGSGRGWWKYSDADTFNPWQDLELFMGYYHNGNDELRRMMVGEIVRMTPNFSANGPATLSVRALNVLNRFRNAQISKDYFQQKDSAIFRDIVGTVAQQVRQQFPNLDLVTDDAEITRNLAHENEIKHLTIKQEYAINFLFKRSRDIRYELSVDDVQQGSRRVVTVHYRPASEVIRPTYILEWGVSLISFQPSLATANQASTVIVRYWNPNTKKKFEGRATLADLKAEGVIDPMADLNLEQGPQAQKTEVVTDMVVQSDAEATEAAKSRLRVIAQGLVTAKGRTIGLPDLRTGSKIQIGKPQLDPNTGQRIRKGLGRYDGNYVVEQTTHTIGDGGYTTDFTARMEKNPV